MYLCHGADRGAVGHACHWLWMGFSARTALGGTQDDLVVVVGEEGDEGQCFRDVAHVVACCRRERGGVVAAGGVHGERAVGGDPSGVDHDYTKPGSSSALGVPLPW